MHETVEPATPRRAKRKRALHRSRRRVSSVCSPSAKKTPGRRAAR